MEDCKKEVSVTVHGESETPMRMKIKSGKFEMFIDEPEGGYEYGTKSYSGSVDVACRLYKHYRS